MTTEERKGDFSRRAGRVKGSPFWVREETRVARLPASPLPEEWPAILEIYEAQRDEKDAVFEAVEKAQLFEKMPADMQALFTTAEDWLDADEDDKSYEEARRQSPISATACIMDHDPEELANASA